MMKIHGLSDAAYHIVQYLWFLLMYLTHITLLIAMGSVANLGIFRNNQYSLQIVRFLTLMLVFAMPQILSPPAAVLHGLLTQARLLQLFYFVWGNVLVAFGFLLSTFHSSVKTAVVSGAQRLLNTSLLIIDIHFSTTSVKLDPTFP